MEYELVHEIKNLCRNNQMRDISFQEITCDDPETYVRGLLRGKRIELSVVEGANGAVTIHTTCDAMMETFSFTPI